jgi:ABC-type uncharacterized transport system substrate-binding protein
MQFVTATVALLLLAFCMLTEVRAEGPMNVVIITSSNSNFQLQTAAAMRESLERDGARSLIISNEDFATSSQNEKTLYVAIGDRAINSLYKFDPDAFVLRVTSHKNHDNKYTSAQSDLITAQPECRHIQLIKSLNPSWSTVGVLTSVNSADIAAALIHCAIKYNLNLQLYAITDNSDLLVTLEAAIEDNKVLLAITDPLIYNSHSVKNILLTAYRHRKPVIGYSDSFVQAGAVAAVYTSPQTIGDKAARIILDFFENNWQFSKNIYTARDFSISINKQVAKSLDITLPAEKSIRKDIVRMSK